VFCDKFDESLSVSSQTNPALKHSLKAHNQTMSLLDIPFVVFKEGIVPHIGVKELGSLSVVSKDLKEFCDDNTVWKKVCDPESLSLMMYPDKSVTRPNYDFNNFKLVILNKLHNEVVEQNICDHAGVLKCMEKCRRVSRREIENAPTAARRCKSLLATQCKSRLNKQLVDIERKYARGVRCERKLAYSLRIPPITPPLICGRLVTHSKPAFLECFAYYSRWR